MIILCLEFRRINFKCVNKKFNNFNKQIILFIKWSFLVLFGFNKFWKKFVFVDFWLRWKIQVRVDGSQHLTELFQRNLFDNLYVSFINIILFIPYSVEYVHLLLGSFNSVSVFTYSPQNVVEFLNVCPLWICELSPSCMLH